MLNGGGPETGHLDIQEKFRALGRLPASHFSNPVPEAQLAEHKEARVLRLITIYRLRGHERAQLNPLGDAHHEPLADLDLAYHDLDESDMDREFDSGSLVAPARMKLRAIIALCKRVYCGSIGIEYLHLSDTNKREWLQQRLEGCEGVYAVNDDERLRILQMLTAAEGLEKYLHTRYVGQKRFSLDGGDALIPTQCLRCEGNVAGWRGGLRILHVTVRTF